MRGGESLGAGGFGRVVTADELLHFMKPSDVVVLHAVQFKTGRVVKQVMRTQEEKVSFVNDLVDAEIVIKVDLILDGRTGRSLAAGTRRGTLAAGTLAAGTLAAGTLAAGTRRGTLDNATMRDELDGNTELLRRIAVSMQRNRVSAAVVQRTSPFVVSKKQMFLVGLSLMTPRKDGTLKLRHCFPMYRRMSGDIFQFYDTFGQMMTVQHVLDLTMNTLYMLREMKAVHAHHKDIKEENMLVEITCPRNRPVRSFDDFMTPGGCEARFSLSDYGLVLFDPSPANDGSGTPGYRSPYVVGDVDEFFRDVQSLLHIPLDPEALWASYQARVPRSSAAKHEKSDLYALGIMLMGFDYEADERTHPLRTFAMDLVLGPAHPGAIMTLERAMQAYRTLRAKYYRTERRLKVRVAF